MVDKIEMSLDDIIQEQKSSNFNGKNARRQARNPEERKGNFQKNKRGGGGGSFRGGNNRQGGSGGGVQKGGAHGGITRSKYTRVRIQS